MGDEDAIEGSKERISKQPRVHKTDEGENDDLEDKSSKKTKWVVIGDVEKFWAL
ncbi:hypothetical protein CsSME_00026467 [Camellia sinensis var. sinensis]